MTRDELERVARRLFDSYGAGDLETMRSLLAQDLELHNFAAFLTRVRDGQVRELWMVDARPAYSEEFWAA